MTTAPRFFLDAPLTVGDRVELPQSVAHHALRVLRLGSGASIILFNGRGGEYVASLEASGATARAALVEHEDVERESPLAIRLIQAWISNDKLDWVVEKSVELGVRSIVMAPTRRSVTRPDSERLTRRIERLCELAVAACCQCGRNRIPTISAAIDLEAALRDGRPAAGDAILLDPDAAPSLIANGVGGSDITLAVGPEGGFDEDEVRLAARIGYVARRLGPRILRTETASVAALAALQATMGDFQASS